MLITSSQKRRKYIRVGSGKNILVFDGFAQKSSASLPASVKTGHFKLTA